MIDKAKVILDGLIISIFLSIPLILVFGAINSIFGQDFSRRIGRIRIEGLGTDFGLIAGMSFGFAVLGGVLALIRYGFSIWQWSGSRPLVRWGAAFLLLVGVIGWLALVFQKTPNEQLATAINSGDPRKVETVLNRNEIDQRYLDSQLNRTIGEGQFEMAASLIASGANINQIPGSSNYSLLQDAILFDDKETILFLIENGADLAALDSLGDSPMMLLIEFRLSKENMTQADGVEIIRAMLAAGADPSHQNDFGRTAQSYAEERGYTEILSVLP